MTVGAAAMLVGGAWWAAQGALNPPGPAVAAAANYRLAVPSLPPGSTQWAASVRVALASVTQQLAEVDQAEGAWNALPPARRNGPTPAAVTRLTEEGDTLTQQQTNLRDQLTNWQSLQEARTALTTTNAELGVPQPTTALVDQAREQQQAVLALTPTVRAAVTAPAPLVEDTATPVVGAALVVTHDLAAPPPAEPPVRPVARPVIRPAVRPVRVTPPSPPPVVPTSTQDTVVSVPTPSEQALTAAQALMAEASQRAVAAALAELDSVSLLGADDDVASGRHHRKDRDDDRSYSDNWYRSEG